MMDEIKHKGVVSGKNGNTLFVTIINEAACAACHSRAACTVSDFKEKQIEITSFHNQYNPGDPVMVVMRESAGLSAVFYAYVLPFALLLISLILSLSFTQNEIISGFVSLGVLVPYFFVLWLLREKFAKSMKFELEE